MPMRAEKDRVSNTNGAVATRSLSALLSQVLVAFTVEFDSEFERLMGEAGHPGARLSLVVWTNLMRFAAEGSLTVGELAAQALAPDEAMRLQLGCLERWGFVVLQDPTGDQPVASRSRQLSAHERRSGWGSGRGLRIGWRVRLTSKGRTASQIWPPLLGEIESRWEKRFGKDEVSQQRRALQAIAGKLEFELPHGLPGWWEATENFPPRGKTDAASLPLATLLSQLLLAFRVEFDRESAVPLALCANPLRVLGETPIRAAEIPRLTGGSPETSDIGWQIKPYVVVQPDPTGKRGKVVALSERGVRVQQEYHRLVEEIERRWEKRFGKEPVRALRESLQALFDRRGGGASLMSQGLVPPRGTVQASEQAPALGRRDVGAAARQRMRDLVAQTEEFVRDPGGTLPHYPAWDMNRGFGP